MSNKLALTIPYLLSGPLIVMLVNFTIYDFTVIGGTLTMAFISFMTVRSLWTDKNKQKMTENTEGHS